MAYLFRIPKGYTRAVAYLFRSAAILLLSSACGLAKSKGCNAPPPTPSVTVEVPGRPFGVAISPDGCWVFATLVPSGKLPGLAVLRHDGGRLTMDRFLPLNGGPTGIAITPDGKRLLVTTGGSIEVLDVAR